MAVLPMYNLMGGGQKFLHGESGVLLHHTKAPEFSAGLLGGRVGWAVVSSTALFKGKNDLSRPLPGQWYAFRYYLSRFRIALLLYGAWGRSDRGVLFELVSILFYKNFPKMKTKVKIYAPFLLQSLFEGHVVSALTLLIHFDPYMVTWR